MKKQYEHYPKWTESRFWSFLRSALRQAWVKYPVRYEALKQAQRPYEGANKRQKHVYICAICRNEFKGTEVQVDHIVPCGTLKGYKDVGPFVKRLFCGPKDLRVLCKPCHKEVK